MWRDGGQVKTAKYAPDEFEFFHNQLKALDVDKVEYGAHWRNATHGARNREMAHPYEYIDADGTPIALMHNGIIDIKTDTQQSDTLAFVDGVLATLKTGWWDIPAMRFLVEGAIGWSRLLLFTPTESVRINDGSWKVDDAVRYSTDPLPKYTYTAPKSWKPMNLKPAPPALPWPGWEGTQKAAWDDDELPPLIEGGELIDDGLEHDGYDVLNGVTWTHEGHKVLPLEPLTRQAIAKDDVVGSCFCDECDTEGEFYVIDGRAYIDISHKVVVGFTTAKNRTVTVRVPIKS
jgi:hypothetical protein